MSLIRPTQCTHIKSNGGLCGSPALKGHDKCYWHSQVEMQVRDPKLQELPILDDVGSIQIVIMKVLRAIAENRIDYKAAQLMIWALQVATRNVKSVNISPNREPGVDMIEQLAAVLAHNSANRSTATDKKPSASVQVPQTPSQNVAKPAPASTASTPLSATGTNTATTAVKTS